MSEELNKARKRIEPRMNKKTQFMKNSGSHYPIIFVNLTDYEQRVRASFSNIK